ncbi:MAG: hypothetical protein ABL930_11340 [Pseudobdellovibrio sp.]
MGKLTLQSLYAYKVIIKSYYVHALIDTKKEKEALVELEAIGQIVDEHLKIIKPDDTLETVIAAHDLRLQALNRFSKTYSKSPKSKALKEQYVALEKNFKPLRDKYKLKSENAYAALNDSAARAKEYDEWAKKRKIEEEQAKLREQESANNSVVSSNEEQVEVGSCTCIKREQYWVAGRSASGLVKAQLGHHEYRDVKVPCPCTN